MDSLTTQQHQHDTGAIYADQPGLAIVEFPVPDEYGWNRDDVTVNTLAQQPAPDLDGWVQTHDVNTIRETIRRAERVRLEHLARAEQAEALQNALRAMLQNASREGEDAPQQARII